MVTMSPSLRRLSAYSVSNVSHQNQKHRCRRRRSRKQATTKKLIQLLIKKGLITQKEGRDHDPTMTTALTERLVAGAWPRSDHFIADCGLTRAYLHEDQFFSGWTVLVLKRHATELFHVSTEERAGMIEEVARVAKVLAGEYRAIKINYELLGSQVPHIHWHLIPRLKDLPELLLDLVLQEGLRAKDIGAR